MQWGWLLSGVTHATRPTSNLLPPREEAIYRLLMQEGIRGWLLSGVTDAARLISNLRGYLSLRRHALPDDRQKSRPTVFDRYSTIGDTP
jgi:hypothetical protein